jgi:hypothetical protein
MPFDDTTSPAVCTAIPRTAMLQAFMPVASDTVPPDISACVGWLRTSVRVGTVVFLALTAIAGLPGEWSAGFRAFISPGPMAAAACAALAALLFVAIPRTLDTHDPRGAGRQAVIHGTVAVAAGAVFIGALTGAIGGPPWMTVAGATLAWFGCMLAALWELTGSAVRRGAAPDVVVRLERRTRSGGSVWLVGLAAVVMVAAVGAVGAWYGTKAPGFALVRLVALALSGYACIGLACWAVVFEVVAAGIASHVHGQRPTRPRS